MIKDGDAPSQKKQGDLDELTYIISHDLQEPLRMVTSYVQLLNRRYGEQLDENAKDYIRYAVEGTSRLKQMMDDLLTYSRIGRPHFNIGQADLAEAVEKAKKNLSGKYPPGSYETTGNFTQIHAIKADKDLLERLFYNMIENALKFNHSEKPVIEINIKNEKDCWTIAVKDNGMGIDRDYHGKIFGIFQKLHNHSEYPGSGLGLAICEKIAGKHGGRIWVESEREQGATFYISISKDYTA